MAILDPTSNIGKMRLRCGDFSDLPIMPDEVYMSALDDCGNNVPRACILVCQYILAALTGQTHQKLAQVEVFGNDWFRQYKEFVLLTIKNPNFMTSVAMPYAPSIKDDCGNPALLPLDQFQRDWNILYGMTEAKQNHITATAIHPYF